MKEGLYGKGNVRIIVAEEQIMCGKRKIDGFSVVSFPQLIVDLFTEGCPAAEAAKMLLASLNLV